MAQVGNSTVTAAFTATLLRQELAALLILAALWLAWLDVRARRAAAGNGPRPVTLQRAGARRPGIIGEYADRG